LLVGTNTEKRLDFEKEKRKDGKKSIHDYPISTEDGIQFAKEIKAIKYLECSHLDLNSIERVFDCIYEWGYNKYIKNKK
ncbi:hypothetical protein EIN_101540, partial [Entamoeba invadens IP1]